MKPIVKYVGGKTWLAPSLSSIIKKIDKFDSYGEAFFGGGGSFFGIVVIIRTPIKEIFNGCSCEIVGRRNIMSSDPNARNQLRNEILIHR